jgi:hypothetical protein
MSGECFSVMVILILQWFDLTLHASLMMICLYSNVFIVFSLKKISGEKMLGIFFSFLGMSDIACIFA